ncbi:hypothetical protein KKH14_00335 [Patescibacteria group bacterium]|nr:hypothetical protein [Patescibacteria group bacterium]
MREKLKKLLKKQKIGCLVLLSFFLVAGGFWARPLLAEYALTKADYYFNGGAYDLSVAAKWYQTAGFLDSQSSLVHYQLARIYFVENKLGEAQKEIDIALAENPANQRAFYIRGLINGFAKNYGEAISDFEKFTAWSPKEWAGWNDLAWASYEAGDYVKTKDAALEGLKIDAANPWLLNNLGLAHLGLGEKDEAQAIFAKAKESSGSLTLEEWQKAYPGNNPNSAEQNLAKFKANVKYNAILASKTTISKVALAKGIAVSACSASTYYHCSGTSCVAYTCDPDHESCSSSCSSDTDCGSCTPRCGDWYACTRSCGGGRQAKSCVRSDCSEYSEEQDCNMQDCPCAPNCGNTNNYCSGDSYGDGCGGTCWGTRSCCTPSCDDWSKCSVSCGAGSKNRTCTRADCSTYSDSTDCNDGCCPEDGGWSGWSKCSVSCGGGTETRSCTNPSPSCGGADCSGPSSQSCNTYACIGNFNLNLGGSVACNSVPLSWTSASGAQAYRILRGSPRIDISPYQPYTALNHTDTTVSQNTTYPYQIEAYNSGASNRSNTINVSVPYCPPTLNFSADNTSIWQGQSVILSWATSYITSCTASGAWSGSKPVNGSQIVVPLPPPSATYNLNCSGSGGSISQSVTVNIAPLALPDWREIIPR